MEYRVFGPPGTGKTTYLAGQVNQAVEKFGSGGVLVTSFTKAAALELAQRETMVDENHIATLHAHGYRALGCPEVAESRLPEWNDRHPAFAVSGGMTIDDMDMAVDHEGDAIYLQMNNLRGRMIPKDQWPNDVQMFHDLWTDWKSEFSGVDFTDMVERCHNENVTPGDFSVGILDEAQDCTPLELALFRKWASAMQNVIIAGDDLQCIYRFKGCTPEAFLNPSIPKEQKRILHQSYRVPKIVKEYAEAWGNRVRVKEPKTYTERAGSEGFVRAFPSNMMNPEPMIRQAEAHIKDGQTVMILSACGYMLAPTIRAMKESGLPFHNPFRVKRGDWNPLSHRRKNAITTADRVLAFLKTWTWVDVHKFLGILKSEGTLVRGAKELAKEMAEFHGGDNPLSRIVEVFKEDVYNSLMDCDTIALLDWLTHHTLATKAKQVAYMAAIYRRLGEKGLTDKPKIIVGTVHSVKGHEADVVFVYPDISKAGMDEWNGSSEEHDSVLRVFYVAYTRAREGLYLCEPATRYHVE